MTLLILAGLGLGLANAAPKVPTHLAWRPTGDAKVVARVQTQGFAVVIDAPGRAPVRAPAVEIEVTARCETRPSGRRQVTLCAAVEVRVQVEAGLSASVDPTLQAWADRWSQATVELEHTLARRPTRLDVLLPPEPGLSSDAAAYREQTDRLLGAAAAQCIGFEVPQIGRAHPDGLSWFQPNLAGVPPLPLRVSASSSGRWRQALKRSGPSISAEGSVSWLGDHIGDAVLVYTLTDVLDGSEARVAHSCRVVPTLPGLGRSGRTERLSPLPDPFSAAALAAGPVE